MRRRSRRTNAVLLIFTGVAVAAAGWLTATFVLDVSDKRVEVTISLTLKIASTLVGIVVAVWGIAKAKDPVVQPSPSSLAVDRPVRVLASEQISEDDSLLRFTSATDALLAELRGEAVPFIALTTTAEISSLLKSPVARLRWVRRERVKDVAVTSSEPVDIGELASRFRRTALLGDPGSGKSTILAEIARRQLEEVENTLSTRIPLPLLVSLSAWVEPSESAIEFLRRQAEQLLGPGNYYVRDFENQIAAGRFLFLLDGLNEMRGRRLTTSDQQKSPSLKGAHSLPQGHTEPLDRREASLRQLAESALSCSFILACRTHEYLNSPDWQVVKILDMDEDQADGFIDAYTGPEIALSLKHELRRNAPLAGIASNPFFLCSIVAAYEPGKTLTSRGDVLDALVVQLSGREAEKQLSPIGDDDMRMAGVTAYRMMKHGLIGDKSPIQPDSEAGWQAVLASTGMLVRRGNGIYFRHQIIQEYFAAVALRRRFVRDSLKRMLADERWSETIALWRDLERRLEKRLVRALRARNLPLRVPRSTTSSAYQLFASLTSIPSMLVVGWYVLCLWLGAVHVMSWPFSYIPLAPVVLALLALALGAFWRLALPHRRTILNAAYVLGRSGNAAVVPRMLRAMRYFLYADRERLAAAIAQFDVQALPQVVHSLRSRRWRIRCGSAQVLNALATRDSHGIVSRAILEACAIPDARLARPLLEALARSQLDDDLGAVQTVVARLGSGPGWLATARAQVLTNSLGGSDSAPIGREEMTRRTGQLLAPANSATVRVIAVRVIGSLRPEGAAAQLSGLADDVSEDTGIRRAAVAALGQLAASEAVPVLLRYVKVQELSDTASQTLRSLKDRSALEPLSERCEDPDWRIRQVVAVNISRIGRASAGPTLTQMAADSRPEVRKTVAQGLALVDIETAVTPLGRLARDPDEKVAEAALVSLTAQRDELSAECLLQLALDESFSNRIRVLKELGAYDQDVVETALRGMGAPVDRQTRSVVARSLRRIERRRDVNARASWRHPLMTLRRETLRWLNWDALRVIARDEIAAGAPKVEIPARIQQRAMSNAEEARRLRNALMVYGWLVSLGFMVAVALLVLLSRWSLQAAMFGFDHWLVLVGMGVVGIVSVLPFVRDLSYDHLVVELVLYAIWVCVGLTVLVLVLGGLTYTWSLWFALTLVGALAGIIAYLATCARSSRRVRRFWAEDALSLRVDPGIAGGGAAMDPVSTKG